MIHLLHVFNNMTLHNTFFLFFFFSQHVVRWLQHTSFLWDFDGHKLNKYLANPAKQPHYRNKRHHGDFLCKLKDRTPSGDPEEVIDKICLAMATLYGAQLEEVSLDHANEFLQVAANNNELTSKVLLLGTAAGSPSPSL